MRLIKLLLIFWSLFCLSYVCTIKAFGEEAKVEDQHKTVPARKIEEFPNKDMVCTSGYCLVNGTLHVDPVSSARYFKLVETSTPTAVPNAVLIWLNAEGSSGTIKAIFDDSTIKPIISNKTP